MQDQLDFTIGIQRVNYFLFSENRSHWLLLSMWWMGWLYLQTHKVTKYIKVLFRLIYSSTIKCYWNTNFPSIRTQSGQNHVQPPSKESKTPQSNQIWQHENPHPRCKQLRNPSKLRHYEPNDTLHTAIQSIAKILSQSQPPRRSRIPSAPDDTDYAAYNPDFNLPPCARPHPQI